MSHSSTFYDFRTFHTTAQIWTSLLVPITAPHLLGLVLSVGDSWFGLSATAPACVSQGDGELWGQTQDPPCMLQLHKTSCPQNNPHQTMSNGTDGAHQETGYAKEFLEEGFFQDVLGLQNWLSRSNLWKKWEIGSLWMRRTLFHKQKNSQGRTRVSWKVNFGKMLW